MNRADYEDDPRSHAAAAGTSTVVREAEPVAKICAGVGLAAEVEAVFRNYFKDRKLGTYGFETLTALNDSANGADYHPFSVAKRLGISSALLSHTLRELEATGMIECARRQGRDRRLVHTRLSETGRAFVQGALRDLNSKMGKIAQRR